MVCSQGGLSKLKVVLFLVVFSANVTSNTPVQPSNAPIEEEEDNHRILLPSREQD